MLKKVTVSQGSLINSLYGASEYPSVITISGMMSSGMVNTLLTPSSLNAPTQQVWSPTSAAFSIMFCAAMEHACVA